MVGPPSDESLICPPFVCITLLIFLIHSTLSVALSAFKTTALCAAREKHIVIKMFSEDISNKSVHIPSTAISTREFYLSEQFCKVFYW